MLTFQRNSGRHSGSAKFGELTTLIPNSRPVTVVNVGSRLRTIAGHALLTGDLLTPHMQRVFDLTGRSQLDFH